MDYSRGGVQTLSQAEGSRPMFTLYPTTVTKDSKAQHILGLSRTQLHNARDQSLNAKTKSVNQHPPPLEKSSRNLFAKSRNKTAIVNVDELPLKSNGRKGSYDQQSDVTSLSQARSLNRYPSNSTLRSFYDAAASPMRKSQQTSNSSSQEFALRKAKSSSQLNSNFTMDVPKYQRFFRSAKLRGAKDQNLLVDDRPEHETEGRFSPVSRRSSKAGANVAIPTIPEAEPLPASLPSKTIPVVHLDDKFLKIEEDDSADQESQSKSSSKRLTTSTLNTPYAKVNVRRPKAGTTNWFDDLDGLTSDEEEPGPRHQDLAAHDRASSSQDDELDTVDLPHEHPGGSNSDDLASSSKEEIYELPADTEIPLRSGKEEDDLLSKSISIRSASKSNPFTQADLSQDSILHLSGSEDECDGDDLDLPQVQPIQSLEHCPAVRESIAMSAHDDADPEIELANAVVTTHVGRTIENRPSPIKVAKNVPGPLLSPMRSSQSQGEAESSDDDSESIRHTEEDLQDVDEDVLLDSFPATPTDTNRPRRTSSHTSSHSSLSAPDDRSFVSMRLMKVTRQEENLIAAMRMKRASMKKAARFLVQDNTNQIQERSEEARAMAERSNLRDQVLQSNGFVPRQQWQTLQSSALHVSGATTDKDDSRPVTACLAESASMDDEQDAQQIDTTAGNALPKGSVSSQLDQRWSSKSHAPFPYQSGRALLHSHYTRSSATPDSEKDASKIIVIDSINSGPSPEDFSPHLLFESPFTTWERDESAATC